MTFYLKPPDGTIPLHLFQQYAECRLQFLISILKTKYRTLNEAIQDNVGLARNMDCLIEGTSKDRVSHFVLASTTLLDSSMTSVVIRGEKTLFALRMNHMSTQELKMSLRILLKHLKPYIPHLEKIKSKRRYIDFLKTLSQTIDNILREKLLKCPQLEKSEAIVQEHNPSTNACLIHRDISVVKVPFTQVPELISSRKASVSRGVVGLKCNQVKGYLALAFVKLLECSRHTMRHSEVINRIGTDQRLLEITGSLLRIFNSHGYLEQSRRLHSERLSINKLNEVAFKYFPPCMLNMYKKLVTTHRLSHQSRVHLTLFLKEIGVPIEESLRLLKQEYSRPGEDKSSHKCEHSWQTDSRKYIYGTRHLYGLEGGRKNYSSHTCDFIQKASVRSGCGGCPFTNCNRNQLIEYFGTEFSHETHETDQQDPSTSSEESDVIPIETCHLLLRCKIRRIRDEPVEGCKDKKNIQFTKPIHFYNHLKQMSEGITE